MARNASPSAAGGGSGRRRALELSALVGGFSALSLWYFRETFMVSPTAAVDLVNFDLYNYVYPMLQYWFDGVRHADVALWNPYQACGGAFAATENGFFYPLNFPHLLFPTGPAIGYTAELHFALAAFFQYGFLRAHGLTWSACLAGALMFMLMPLLAAYAWYPGLQNATVWIAAMLWACERLVRRPTTGAAAALAAAIGLQLLAGRTQTVVYTWYVFAPYAFGRALSVWRREAAVGRRVVLFLGGAVIIGGALAAVQMIPEVELQARSMRSTAGLTRLAAEAYPGSPSLMEQWATLLTLGSDRFGGRGTVPPYGWHLLACAIFGVALVRRRLVWFFAAVAGIFLVLSAGSHTPLYDIYYRLPSGSWFRAPLRLLFLTVFALDVLAALGIDAALRRPERAPASRAWLAVPLLASGLVWWQAPSLPVAVLALGFAAGWGIILVFAGGVRRLGGAVVAVVLALELISIRPAYHAHPAQWDGGYRTADARLRRDVARQLRPGMRVFYPYHPYEYVPLAKVGLLDGFATVTDYEPLTLRRFRELVGSFGGMAPDPFGAVVFFGDFSLPATPAGRRLLDLMSVDLVVQRGALAQPDPLVDIGLQPIGGQGQARLYRNPNALPRALVVGRYVVEPDPQQVLARLAEPSFDPHQTVVLEEPPTVLPQAGASGSVTVARDDLDSLVLAVTASAPALLVLTDTAYPGWRVSVDGRAERLQRANYMFRAVAVGAGTHEVRFVYRPASFLAGAVLSLVASGLVIAALPIATRRRGTPARRTDQAGG